MSISTVTVDDLRRMNGKEGLFCRAAAAIRRSGWTASTIYSPMRVF